MWSTIWFHLSWGTLVCSANPLVCSVAGLCNSGSEAHQSVHAHSPWPHRQKQADVVCWGERGGPGEERPGRVQVPKAGGRVRKFFLIFFFFLSFFFSFLWFCFVYFFAIPQSHSNHSSNRNWQDIETELSDEHTQWLEIYIYIERETVKRLSLPLRKHPPK